MKPRWMSAVWPPLASFAILALFLESALAIWHVPAYLMPPPSAVLTALIRDGAELSRAAAQTGWAALCGLALSAALGSVIAMLMSLNPWIRRAFYPYAVFFQTVPVVAIAPMLVVWFGYGIRAVSAAAFIVSVFPVIANTLSGLLASDPSLRDLFRIYRATRWATLVKLDMPSAVPHFLTGLRIASGLAVIGAIVGEFVADTYQGGGGIGTAVQVAIKEQKTDKVFAAVGMASMLGLLFFAWVNLASLLAIRHWHIVERKD